MQDIDFIVSIEEDREIRILQLTDTQIIDSSQSRIDGRLSMELMLRWDKKQLESCLFQYIRDVIKQTKPDLILVTGDIVYGEFDDDGSSLIAFIEHMDSYGIPWAPIYGNHDNESKKGAFWQNEQFLQSKYCLFKKGTTDGNGNYTIGIMQGGKLIRVFYMMDSNGCVNTFNPVENDVVCAYNFTDRQIDWLHACMRVIASKNGGNIPSSVCMHKPIRDFDRANEKYSSQKPVFTLGRDLMGVEGDFGSLRRRIKGLTVGTSDDEGFRCLLKQYGVDSVFAGHLHETNTSVVYDGIRWTFGLKTGVYDSYTDGEVGGTLITLFNDTFKVKHVYYQGE